MRTENLTGAYLDYFTGLADGKPPEKLSIRRVPRTGELICVYNGIVRYDPSTNAEKGLDVMERSRIELTDEGYFWSSYCEGARYRQAGDTILQAAMRCKVASLYGDEVPDIEITE